MDEKIREKFSELAKKNPERLKKNMNFSWSNWGFGRENLSVTADRLKEAGIKYIELHGNRYGENLGYDASEVRKVLEDRGVKVSGICGMFSPARDLSSNKGWVRQNAIDYIERNIKLGKELGAEYFLIVPGAVGRPDPIDKYEMDRSIETLGRIADKFTEAGIKGAVEPIRSAEVSFCHTFEDAVEYIERLDHPGVQWINGDVYHMMQEESHVGEVLKKHGDRLVNLHLADSNRRALGSGMLNLDVVIMSLYLIEHNEGKKFVTAEPLGPGGSPYPAMHAKHDPERLTELVNETIDYFRSRERVIKKSGANRR
ncbi:sugar phosphate isomerase [candidate division MSBL1 archaeon SCGC-AAA259A05]|uniref:Sugar phosphate isomerase n=1 Tax=candidate division MSBL1 archaeon SCGC-AAA259A05 TaxID=1698259 RepID=A0A133UAE1_9EURY|nr:sugar phosphate isomerase [candidate division MSBL1 archaeon SCGC-AAA259A05]